MLLTSPSRTGHLSGATRLAPRPSRAAVSLESINPDIIQNIHTQHIYNHADRPRQSGAHSCTGVAQQSTSVQGRLAVSSGPLVVEEASNQAPVTSSSLPLQHSQKKALTRCSCCVGCSTCCQAVVTSLVPGLPSLLRFQACHLLGSLRQQQRWGCSAA